MAAGTFFTQLSEVQVGESVFLTDKFGTIREYTVTESYVVGPYENSIKDQGDKEELTSFYLCRKWYEAICL